MFSLPQAWDREKKSSFFPYSHMVHVLTRLLILAACGLCVTKKLVNMSSLAMSLPVPDPWLHRPTDITRGNIGLISVGTEILERLSITFTANAYGKNTKWVSRQFSRLPFSSWRPPLAFVNNASISFKFFSCSVTIIILCLSPVMFYLFFYANWPVYCQCLHKKEEKCARRRADVWLSPSQRLSTVLWKRRPNYAVRPNIPRKPHSTGN